MANEIIRTSAKSHGVSLWEIALHLGVSEATITRKLRIELTERERAKFIETINEIVKRKNRK